MTVGKPLEARPTCPVCDAVDRLMGLIRASRSEYETGRERRLQLYELERDHPKCRKCGIFFGGTHGGEDEGQGMCGWCNRKYARIALQGAAQ